MRPVRVIAVAVVLSLLGLLVWDVVHQDGTGIAGKVNKGETVKAPSLELPRLGGGTFDLAAYRGKVVVLNFWASWCVDCKLEAKTLHDEAAKAATRWHGKVVVVGIDTKDLASAARGYMKRYQVNYGVVRDLDGSQSQRWGVTGYPETFFVDRQGKVVPPHLIGPVIGSQLVGEMNGAIERALRS